MQIAPELGKRLKQMVPTMFVACVFGYFVYHAVHGDRGIIAWIRLDKQLEQSQAVLDGLQAERAVIEHRVSLLSSNGLDPDLLEEQAQIMLNFGHADDRVIVFDRLGDGPVDPGFRGVD